MKQILCALLILTATPAALAQEAPASPPVLPETTAPDATVPETTVPETTVPETTAPQDRGIDLMEEGAKLLFRGLMGELEPMFDDMGKALKDMEPALQQLLALVDDIRNYDAPMILDNGDILIPRRKGAPPPLLLRPDPLAGPDGATEL